MTMAKNWISFTILGLALVFIWGSSRASRAEESVGRAAAQKYFQSDSGSASSGVLMLHYGQFLNSDAYSWADASPVDGAGLSTFGITGSLEEWHGFDLNLRADLINYNLNPKPAQQLIVMPLLTFPRAQTGFPLYFGAGLGPGIFTQQIANKSVLAIDYELLIGARFMHLYEGVGVFIEGAMKNDFFALSTGQFIGTALEFGFIFNL